MRIEVPKDEPVRLGRVGLIALAGFVVGIVWPRLAGMQLVPSAPVEEDPRPKELAAKPSAKPAPKTAESPAAAGDEPPTADRIKIDEVVVTSCRGALAGDKEECDDIDFDSVARSRILTLAACPAAQGQTGTLSVGFDLDFEKNSVSNIRSGVSTSFDRETTGKLIACVGKEFQSASLAGVKHAYKDYTVFYKLELLPEPAEREGTESPDGEPMVEASGRATVGWQVALIRKEPRDGAVVARILSGTNVIVTGRQGDWYRVKYDGKGNEGWVYRSAIGL